MSRLELGPEDNPNYVIDENQSGDLEVRDSGGSVIATYKQDGTTEVGTIIAEDVDIGSGESSQDFVASGDVLPLICYNANNESSTTSTSYTWAEHRPRLQWSALSNGGDRTMAVGFHVNATPGTDETHDIRIWNNSDSETVLEETGITSPGQIWTGWSEYTPPTTDSPIHFRLRHRTNPGNNSSEVQEAAIWIGVVL